ncbi:MAG: hypothetical protein H8E26_05695 [FCB group bacterium]|nr:hypothetical protein [FCB group bacterium]MBL7027561.1 hypothetical protein [Candidatus Neomarinimicrobiota bacterium]MBL7121191.1 hypothetical protein [Candidatus Neomarinimicrobiota bacterium]
MKLYSKSILVLLILLAGLLPASQVDQIIEINDAAESWISKDGRPLYYTSSSSQYMIDNQTVRRIPAYNPNAAISLSPNGEYRLFSLLQDLGEIKNNQRYSDYFVLNNHSELLYAVNRGSDSDLKPLVAAISDNGILALVDPVKALIYFYESGNLIAEGQLYEDDGEMSMERNVLMQWVGDQCYILLERPGFNGGSAGKSLFIRVNSDGRGQITSYLPFTYLQKLVFQNQRFFVSGYDYSAADQEMKPMIAELRGDGKMLWNNENFGHELKVSANGQYLAVLSSHEFIQLFDLNSKRVEKIRFDNNNRVCLGLSVNNQGQVAVIRVAADFFAKRNTHFSQIFFPQSKENTDVQIDPRFPKLFQIQNDGDRFFIGTNYEWLEISQ